MPSTPVGGGFTQLANTREHVAVLSCSCFPKDGGKFVLRKRRFEARGVAGYFGIQTGLAEVYNGTKTTYYWNAASGNSQMQSSSPGGTFNTQLNVATNGGVTLGQTSSSNYLYTSSGTRTHNIDPTGKLAGVSRRLKRRIGILPVTGQTNIEVCICEWQVISERQSDRQDAYPTPQFGLHGQQHPVPDENDMHLYCEISRLGGRSGTTLGDGSKSNTGSSAGDYQSLGSANGRIFSTVDLDEVFSMISGGSGGSSGGNSQEGASLKQLSQWTRASSVSRCPIENR